MKRKTKCQKLDRFIDSYVDGELNILRKRVMERHLSGCSNCSRKINNEIRLKNTISHNITPIKTPDHLKQRITEMINQAEYKTPLMEKFYFMVKLNQVQAVAFASILVIVITSAIIAYRDSNYNAISNSIISEHIKYVNGKNEISKKSSDINDLLNYFYQNENIKFEISSPNFSEFQVMGGEVRQIKNIKTACFLLEKQNRKFSFHMFKNGNKDFSGMKTIDADGICFYCDDKKGYNTVIWVTKNIVCSLTSDVPEKDLINYALNIW
jgi:hypothetical protein